MKRAFKALRGVGEVTECFESFDFRLKSVEPRDRMTENGFLLVAVPHVIAHHLHVEMSESTMRTAEE